MNTLQETRLHANNKNKNLDRIFSPTHGRTHGFEANTPSRTHARTSHKTWNKHKKQGNARQGNLQLIKRAISHTLQETRLQTNQNKTDRLFSPAWLLTFLLVSGPVTLEAAIGSARAHLGAARQIDVEYCTMMLSGTPGPFPRNHVLQSRHHGHGVSTVGRLGSAAI